ncbi:MAG: DUF2779 domain-containing protein [Bacteroidota bacterium]|nr:DUF2779 domain-containing protein [Bacteroidota bacterium]
MSASQQALFNRGTDIGVLAQDIFPGGIDASPVDRFDFQKSVIKTRELIENGTEVIYEAAFQFDGVLAAIDIMVKNNDKWYAYEVKSSSKVSGVYIMDAALQYYVITNGGTRLQNISIINLNTEYVREGELELRKLFKATSVIEEVLSKQELIKNRIEQAKATLTSTEEPEIKIGKHCFDPYPCDFMGHCWKNVPEGSVFELAGMHKTDLFEMYDAGITTIEEIPSDFQLKKLQQIQKDYFNKITPFIDKEGIRNFLSSLKYPLYFMDFETFMPAVPMFEGTSPFQHIPFQYSLHYKKNKKSEVTHTDFIAQTGNNPSKDFIISLLKDTENKGDILVYNLNFEKGVLKKLKQLFPEFEFQINDRISRMKDLMLPFQNLHYYHSDMKGSHSIKNVLPALVPELKYDELPINNGNNASAAFEMLQKETDLIKIAETRQALYNYCKLDTLAMVRILEVLEEGVK